MADYHAIRSDCIKIQIKGRVLSEISKIGQRISSIRLIHEWDSLMLVLLDEEYRPVEIYEALRIKVEAALKAPGSKARNERGALGLKKFLSIAQLVWCRDDVPK
jgi:hypothetical protein